MSKSIPLAIRYASWANTHDQAALQSIRRQVFIEEQAISLEDEWDGKDHLQSTHHFLAFVTPGDKAIACARVLCSDKKWKIGRVAVLERARGKAVAQSLLQFIIDQATLNHITTLELESQCYIVSLYEKLGFEVCSSPFMDAGIEHVRMQRVL